MSGFDLGDYEYDGGNQYMDSIKSTISANSGIVFGLLVVLGLFAIYSIWCMMNATPEKFSPTQMSQYILRDGIGENFNVATDCTGVSDPTPNGIWDTLNTLAHTTSENMDVSSRAASPISDAQFNYILHGNQL